MAPHMSEPDKTTAIIPTYNRPGMLVEAVESLLAQTLPPAEIIVVDDGSPTPLDQALSRFGDKVTYIRKQNSGKADTLNQTIPTAKHPFIWIFDDDDIAVPTALEVLSKALMTKPEADFAYGRYLRFDNELKPNGANLYDCGYWREATPETFLSDTLEDFFVHHPGLLVRRSAYEAVGPFSTRYSRLEDYEMLVRLARNGVPAIVDSVVFYQRQHDGLRLTDLAAEQRRQTWIDQEQVFFSELFTSLTLEEFLPTGVSISHPENKRRALIMRGIVRGRKKFWEEAFDDWMAAGQVLPEQALSDIEITALKRAIFSKYGCEEVLAGEGFKQANRQLSKLSPVGQQMAKAIARPMVWLSRQALAKGEVSKAAGFAQLFLSARFSS